MENNEFNSKDNKTFNVVKIQDENKKHSSGFGKTVLVPFFSGIIGAGIVVGTCFGVPNIKKQILGSTPNTLNESSKESVNMNDVNTNLISLAGYSDTGISVANKVRPSIVGIKVEFSVNSIFYRGQTGTVSAEGSGVIISQDGYILTNNHVVNSGSSESSSFYEVGKATKVTVYLYNDETPYEATIIGTDEQTDLAVIKIDKSDLTSAELGNSDTVQVGEFCMAVGNPLGMQSSVSSGMISAVNRKVTDSDGKNFTLIQTDAAINSGNSGGALVNSKGEVIGINTLKMSGTGIEGMGFAIPINSTKTIYEQLIEFKTVKRPYIGITGINLDEATAKANNLVIGIYVRSVEDFSAAQKADIRNGDVIIAVDGKSIKTMDELNEIKNSHNIGDTITLKINRNGTEKDINLTLGEKSNSEN